MSEAKTVKEIIREYLEENGPYGNVTYRRADDSELFEIRELKQKLKDKEDEVERLRGVLGDCRSLVWLYGSSLEKHDLLKEFSQALDPDYFDQDEADENDIDLRLAKSQGYVPQGCLLNGTLVLGEVSQRHDPCAGCEGPRDKCGGRPKEPERRGVNYE